MEHGEQSVMTRGTFKMQMWCVGSWDLNEPLLLSPMPSLDLEWDPSTLMMSGALGMRLRWISALPHLGESITVGIMRMQESAVMASIN